jgi:3-oxosteroid 1-dehydrogenase
MREAWWAPTIVPPGASTAWVMVIEKSLPHGCFVDRRGERFVNEAANYSDVGRGMYEADAETHAAVPAWWIFDGRFRKKFPAGPIQPAMMQPDRKLPSRLRPGAGWLRKGETLDELAAQLDVPGAALRATVDRFNGHCRAGSDPDFGRGATLNDRHYSDPRVKPNPSLGPIDKPPFYAVPVVPGDLGTKSGLVTDTSGRVLDDAGQPIAGLYAAGNVTSSVMGRAYPGAGATLAPAMTFAFLAAEAMSADAG